MDRSEILWRFRSLLNSQMDFARVPLKLYAHLDVSDKPTFDEFVAGFRCDPYPGSLGLELTDEWPKSWTRRLLKNADLVLQNKLSYFDLLEKHLGDPIDWQKDHSSEISGPWRQSIFIDYRDFENVGDCKLVWEPNRHHQLVVLARAWKITGKIKYAERIVTLIMDWISANPFGYGMNWRSPLEVGIRLINWIWAIDFTKSCRHFNTQTWSDTLDAIYLSIWDIQRKYSRGSSANNHLIGEAAAVFIGTSYFSFLPNAESWRTEAKQLLEDEILAQTYSDGCTREHAFGYQIFVMQFFTLVAMAGDATNNSFSANYMNRLHSMFRFMANICCDTARPPNMGDSDDGYVLDLGELPDQTAELIAVGERLFADANLRLSEKSETAFWLYGNSKTNQFDIARRVESVAYKESGYFILRSDPNYTEPDKVLSVFFDCAELGYGSIAAHGHADCLSFTLNIGGQPVFVDSGTYDYFSYPEWRSYFRSSTAHNVLVLDGTCQSESLGPFLWGRRAEPKLLEWQDDQHKTLVSGCHDGYTRLAEPATHQRTLILDKIDNTIEIMDRIETKGFHQVHRYFHLAHTCSVEHISDEMVRIRAPGASLDLKSASGPIEVEDCNTTQNLGWISSGYHEKETSICLVIQNEIRNSSELAVTITVAI